MRCLWIKLRDFEPFPLHYDEREQALYATFEEFCANYRTGWTARDGTNTTEWTVEDTVKRDPQQQESHFRCPFP
jgi:hypothetical protein